MSMSYQRKESVSSTGITTNPENVTKAKLKLKKSVLKCTTQLVGGTNKNDS